MKHLNTTKMKHSIFILIIMTIFVGNIFSQDYSSYQTGFTTGANANLYELKDGTAFDMTGSTVRIAASLNDVQTGNINFGFDFYHYANSKQTKFAINSNGVIRLQGTPGKTKMDILKNNQKLLSPLAGDLATSSSGKVHTKTILSSTNRVMVVEFLNMKVDKNSSCIGTFQVRFYETTGMIEFVYGDFTGTPAGSFQTGISRDDNSGNYVVSVNPPIDPVVHTATLNSLTTFSAVGNLDPGLGVDKRRYYRFVSVGETKPAAPEPAGDMFTATSCGSMTFNWKDNSTTETWFDVYSSTDGLVYTFQGRKPSTTWETTSPAPGTDYSFVAKNLTPNTNYYYKIVARNDSYTPDASSELTSGATFGTTDASSDVTRSITDGDWEDIATWDNGVPTSCMDVYIENGDNVRINNSNNDRAYCNNLLVDNGTLRFDNYKAGYLYVGGNVTVEASGNFTGASGADADQTRLYISGNLTVNIGNFNMEGATEGSLVYFYNPQKADIKGSGGTCNFYYININKGNTPTGFTVDVKRPITIEEPVADAASRLVISNGTFKISSDCGTLKPYRGSATVCAATGKFHLDNAATTINFIVSGNTDATFNGDFELSAGIFNAYRNMNVDGILTISGGTLTTTTGDLILRIGSTSTISNGATVTLFDDLFVYDDLTVSGAATSITCDNINISDNTTTQLGTLTYSGATTNCNTWSIYGVATINSGSITVANAITIKGYTTLPNGSLTLNNTANVTSQNGTITVTGNLTMSGNSVFNSGDGNDGFLVSYGKTVNISGSAIINHFGNMDFLNANGGANLIMAGSSQINLDPQHTQSDAKDDVLLFESTTTATCTGGTITFIDPNINNTAVDNNTFDIKGTAGNMDFSGVNIQFKNGALAQDGGAGAYGGFKIRSYATDITFADIIINNSGGANREVHLDRQTGQADNFDFTCNNLTIIAGTFDVEFHKLTVLGDITNQGNLLTTIATTGEIIFKGTSAQAYNGTGTYTLDNLTFDNSSTGVTLNSPFGANTIKFTNGKIHTSTTNILTVEGTNAANLTGGSSTAYVNGPLKRNFADNASATYVFPIGKVAYLPYELTTTVSGSASSPTLTAEVFEATTGGSFGTGLTSMGDNDTYWKLSKTGTISLSGNTVKLTHDVNLLASAVVAQCNTLAGTYEGFGGTVVTKSVNSTDELDGTLPSNITYFIIGDAIIIEYYSKSTGNLHELATWGVNSDGSGSQPANFNVNMQVFNIYNRTTTTLVANWDLTALGQKIVVGDGTNPCNFTVPTTSTCNNKVDVSANGILTLQNTALPTFGDIISGTVVYDQTADVNIDVSLTYGNITVSNTGIKTLTGNLTVTGGKTLLIDAGGIIDAQTNKIVFDAASGVNNINGKLITSNTLGFSGLATTTIDNTNSPTINLGTSSEIEYNSTVAQTITGRDDYATVTCSNAGAKTIDGLTDFKTHNLNIENTCTFNTSATNDIDVYVYQICDIKAGGNFTANTTATGCDFYLGGAGKENSTLDELRVNGNLTLTGTSGMDLIFEGTDNAIVSGTGATCDIFRIATNKGATPTGSVADFQRTFTIADADATITKRFVVTTGTLKLSGNLGAINPYRGAQTISATNGKLHIDNAGTTIDFIVSGNTDATFNGDFELSAGTFNAQQHINILGNLIMSGGILSTTTGDLDIENGGTANISGGTINLADDLRILIGGTGTIAGGTFNITDDVFIYDNLTVSGVSTNIIISDDITLTDDASYDGVLTFADATMTCDAWSIYGAATINSGSITVANAITIRAYTTFPNGSLIMNNTANVTSQNGTFTVTGDLTMTGNSILTAGNGNDLFAVSRGKTVTLSNTATINHNGRMQFLTANGGSTLTMNDNSEIKLDPQIGAIDIGANDILEFQSGSTVTTGTGGKITFIDPKSDASNQDRNTLQINGTNKDFSNISLQFGDGVSNSSGTSGTYGGFKIRSYNTDITLADIIVNNPTGTDREVSINRETGQADNFDFTCNNLTITAGTFDIEFHNLTVKGNITNAGNLLSTTQTTGEIIFNGTAAQSYSGAGTYTLDNLTFNNSSTGVTLNAPLGANTVTLTNGLVHTTNTNLLLVLGTASTNLVGGSSTVFVNGPMARNIGNSETGDYYFPIGESGNCHATWLTGVVSTAGTGTYIAEFISSVPSGGPVTGFKMDSPNSQNYWKYTQSGTNVLSSANVKLYQTNPVIGSESHAVGQSNTDAASSYQPRGADISVPTISSSLPLDLTFPANKTYFVIGVVDVICQSGTITIGTGGDYATLTEVFTALSMYSIPGHCDIKLRSDYSSATETFPITVPVITYAAGPWTTTLVPEVAGRVIEGTPPTIGDPLFVINGTDNFVIDGRINKTGAAYNLRISNTALAADAGATIILQNDVLNSEIKYTTIEGRSTGTSEGTLQIGTGTSTGNDNNTISYNKITNYSGSNPRNAIYANGTSGQENSSVTITENEIYSFGASSSDFHGIYVNSGNTDWTISNNKIYQSATISTSGTYHGIRISDATNGENFTISGNTIGYANNGGTGNTTLTGSGRFIGIRMNTSNGTVSNIDNNTITALNITTSNTSAGTDYGIFSGIYLQQGKINVGNSTANNIGSTTANNAITFDLTSSGGNIFGVRSLSTKKIRINNNLIGGFNTNNGSYFKGIHTAGNGAKPTIQNNTIGSTTLAHNIELGDNGATTSKTEFVGIQNNCNSSDEFSGNTIANLTAYGSGTGASYSKGIYNYDSKAQILNNIIYNLTTYSGYNGTTFKAALTGICQNSPDDGQIVSGNTIYGFNALNNSGTPDVRVYGIYSQTFGTAPDVETDEIKNNIIHSFSSPSTDAEQIGIYHYNGFVNIHNNMIRLGIDASGADNANQVQMYGIYDLSDDNGNNYLYNSIYIGGTVTTPEALRNSYAFYKPNSSIVTIKNNIFINDRSNNATTSGSKHFAYFVEHASVITSDYNIYGAAGTDGVLAYLDGMKHTDLRGMQFYTDFQEMHSAFGTISVVNFRNVTGAAAVVDMRIQSNSSCESTGLTLGIVTSDFEGHARSGTAGDVTDIGADAGNYTITNVEDIFAPTFEFKVAYDKKYADISTVPSPIKYQLIIRDQGPSTEGIDETNKPRMYFRRAGSNTSLEIDAWGVNTGIYMYVEGNKTSGGNLYSEWDFDLSKTTNFDGILADLDLVEFFFVAQDKKGNVGYSNFCDTDPVFTNVSTATKWPTASKVEYFAVGVFLSGNFTIDNTIPASATNYQTITGGGGLFQAINGAFLNGNLNVTVVSSHNEPGTYSLETIGYSPANSNFPLYISPFDASEKVLTCNSNNDLIKFEGANYVTIDGRLNKTGTDKFLKFIQPDNSRTAFTFSNNAHNIIVRNSIIEGSADIIPKGVIKFASGYDANGDLVKDADECNKDITILNNTIQKNTNMPKNMIYSGGSWTPTRNITIQGNEISNFELRGIWVTETGNGNSWTISDNTMFNDQTGFAYTENQTAIAIEAGEAHVISGNVIGGSTADQTGTNWEYSPNPDKDFTGIYLGQSAGITSTTSLNNNTIQKIETTNSAFRGIYNTLAKLDITYNTIQNITIHQNRYTNHYGIYHNGEGGDDISYNTIQDITNEDLLGFYAIELESTDAAATTIDGNIIQGINNSQTGNKNFFRAIYIDQGWVEIGSIAGNIIGGTDPSDYLQCAGTDSEGVIGICFADDKANCKVENNIISGLRSNSATLPVKAIEIIQTGSNILINNNTISDLQTTTGNMPVTAIDLISASSATVSNNIIGANTFPIKALGTGNVNAIKIPTTSATISGNYVSNLEAEDDINGIWSSSSSNTLTNNTVENVTIATAITFNAINSSGSSASIQDNKINNISLTNVGSATLNGILSTGSSSNIGTTTGNIIGEVSKQLSNAGTGDINAIKISGGTGTTVSNNKISYLNPTGTGNANGIISTVGTSTISSNTISDITSATDVNFRPISSSGATAVIQTNNINTISLTGASKGFNGVFSSGATASIQDNTIKNIAITSSGTLNAIEVSGNNSNIGTSTANTIGAASNTVRNSGTGETNGINISSSTGITVQNNNFSDISGAGNVNCIKSTGTNVSILDHTITGLTIADNNTFSGIRISGGSGSVQNNKIHTNTVSANGNSTFIGIYLLGGSHTVSANKIYGISSASTNTNAIDNLALQGILLNGTTTATVSSNTIYNLNCTGASTNVAGISENVGNVDIVQNKIYNIRNTGGTSASGVLLNKLSGQLSNNMITLGTDSENPIYYGINVSATANAATKDIWYNSVCIKGTATGGGNSYAFYRANNSSAVNLKNNIFSNFRTGASTKNYGICNGGTATNWISNYNNLYSATTSQIGSWNGADKTLSGWQTSSTVNDKDSFDDTPPFTNMATGDLHINPAAACNWNGLAEDVGINVDYDGDNRNTPTTRKDVGADEFNPTGGNGDDFWTGATDTDWKNTDNWGCELVPTTSTNVSISDVTNDPVVIGTAIAVCNDIELKASAILTINSAQLLNVSGDMIINGTFNIKSDGSLLNTGTITGTGTANIERYFKSVKYHYFTPPLVNQSSAMFTNVHASPYWNPNLIYYDEPLPNSEADYLLDWQYAYTDETTPQNLTVGTGYAVYFDSSPTIVFTGAASGISTGAKTIPITNTANGKTTDGWNLVGNPYPSAISADDFITANSTIDGTLYFWDDDGSYGADYNKSDYASWNGAGAVGSGAGVVPNGNISSMQAFFVKKTGTANLSLNNSMRVQNTTQFYKRSNNYVIQKLKISLSNQKGLYNETLLSFLDDATEGVDRMYDGEKFKGNKNIALYSKLDGKDYAIQALPTLRYGEFEKKTIPIGFDITLEGEYEFNKVKFENFESSTNIYLEDRLLKNLHDLSQDSPYKFYTKSGKITERFRVIFSTKVLTKEDVLGNSNDDEYVSIYSNRNNIIAVINDNEILNSRVIIYNSQTGIVFQKNYNTNVINVRINSPSGIYLVQIIANNKSYSKKVYISNE